MTKLIEQFVIALSQGDDFSVSSLEKLKRKFSSKNKVTVLRNDELVQAYHNLVAKKILKENPKLERLIAIKNTRSDSGIVVVAVLTKPYPCPGRCIFCPSEPSVPKSYLSGEPAVMRAIDAKYDPFIQVTNRLKSLNAVGHVTDKISIRIVGGTWSSYEKQYQSWFVKKLFQACNSFGAKGESWEGESQTNSLIALQKENEIAKHRIVELSVETRQDLITTSEIKRLRMLGVTKVELGVQSLYDDILHLNQRETTNEDTIRATLLLRNAGFKISYQMMLNLPGSTPEKDLEMFRTLFSSPDYQPDHLKIYPLALLRNTGAFHLYEKGGFKPYTKQELIELISQIKEIIPSYCRVERVIRDIPAHNIVEGGVKISNLRQSVAKHMSILGTKCKCIRCREIKGIEIDSKKLKFYMTKYSFGGGTEYFLSIEDSAREILASFLRLRLSESNLGKSNKLKGCAIIREIHTYGPVAAVGTKPKNATQHKGLGKRLIRKAEKIALSEGYSKIAVIAGIGVREYFRKLDYELEETYMVKKL